MMKQIITVLVLLAISIGANAQKLTISGMVDSEINSITFKQFDPNTLDYEDIKRANSNDGRYSFTIDLDEPTLYQLDFSGARTVTLSYTNEKDVVVDFKNGEISITGSASSVDMQKFNAQNGALQQKHFAQLKKDADEAMKNGDREALQEIQARSEKAIAAFLPELRAWIESKGVGPAGYHALQYSDFNKELDYISNRLEDFKTQIPNSPVTKALELQVYRSSVLSVGKVPPSIEALDRAGVAMDFEAYKGKVLLIDFWAAWCRACRIENPQFVELYSTFNAQGFEVLSISQDRKTEVWEQAIAKDGVGIWRHIQDADGKISERFAVSSLPQNLVIGKDGRIIAKNVKAEELKKLLESSL